MWPSRPRLGPALGSAGPDDFRIRLGTLWENPSAEFTLSKVEGLRASLGEPGIQKLGRLRLARLWRAGEAGPALA